MSKKIYLGSIVTSDSPKGTLNKRDLINVLFTGLLGCLPAFLNSLTIQLPLLDWGSYGSFLPVILILIKIAAETLSGKSTN